jgi:hypothetical protein
MSIKERAKTMEALFLSWKRGEGRGELSQKAEKKSPHIMIKIRVE